MASTPPSEDRRLAAIMFTDMVGFSALAHSDEPLALHLLAEQQTLLRSHFAQNNGREVKATGDGFLAEFPSALDAARCAVAIQEAIVSRNAAQPANRRFQVRIGIHVGDVVHWDGDVVGDGVNIASRIEPLAEAGGICISETIHTQVHRHLGLPLTKLDPQQMKNIDTPLAVYRIDLPWQSALPAAASISTPRTFPIRPIALITTAVLLALAGGLWLRPHRKGASPPTAAAQTASPVPPSSTDQKSVAVLPFVNMSSDKENEYLSDGISEELLNALVKVPGLHVPARTSSFSFKGKNEDIKKIGELLHVSTVLEGSVRKAGNRIRITAQLVNVGDGFHLWSEEYDRDMTNMFAIEDEITKAIMGKLKVSFAPQPTKQPVKLEAWELYQRARYRYRETSADLQATIQLMKKAIQIQPNYSDAHIGLAGAYLDQAFFGYAPPSLAVPLFRNAVRSALTCDESNGGAHAALGDAKFYFDWDWLGAESEYRRAIALDPALAGLYSFVELLEVRGRIKEAIAVNDAALRIDPLDSAIRGHTALLEMLSHNYDRATEIAREVAKKEPSYWQNHEDLGMVLFRKGERQAGIRELETATRLDTGTRQLARLGRMYGQVGRSADARRILRLLLDRRRARYTQSYAIAWTYEGLCEFEAANTWMLRAIQDREPEVVFLKVFEDDLNRRNPYFRQWLKKIGLDK